MKAPGYRTIRHGEASIASKILGPEHPTNEDSFASVLDISEELLGEGSPADSIAPLSSFFVVSDGHAGNGVSRMVRDELPKAFALSESFNSLDMPVADSLAGALVGGLKELETKIWDQAARGDPDSSGACLVAVALRGSHLCVANLGDCQALLLPPNGAPVELTKVGEAQHISTSPSLSFPSHFRVFFPLALCLRYTGPMPGRRRQEYARQAPR
ncbi:unnamed protein product [Chrysoparadoxa australica]